MKTALVIGKEFLKHVDIGSNRYTVTVVGVGVDIVGVATHIFEGNSFHLDEELCDALEARSIDYAEVVEALEDSLEHIDVDIPTVLMVGEQLYREDVLNHPFEVIRVAKSAYYLAILDGSSSKIDYISKSLIDESIGKTWFRTKEEVIENRVHKLQREIDYLSGKAI